MAKSSKKRPSKSHSVDDIYELIKGKNFTQDLWLDLLSDIKEKPTYIRMRDMVDCVINDTLSDFEKQPAHDADRLRRRTALSDISVLAYTIDRVISEVLYTRLQNEFKTLIGNMLEELRTKPVGQNSTPVKIHSMLENIESIFSEKVKKEQNENAKSSRSSSKATGQIQIRKKGRPSILSKSRVAAAKDRDVDSDGNVSLDSISSVNTDDLSSFDDSVSICTEDGNNGRKMRKVPLKKANNMVVEGKLSQIYQIRSKGEEYKKKNAQDSSLNVLPRKKRKPNVSSLNVLPQKKKIPNDFSLKVLPQRKRKPNTKYNAKTMYCQVKDYSSPRIDKPISSPADDIATIQSQAKQEAKRMKTSNNETKKVSPARPISTRLMQNETLSKNGLSDELESSNSTSSPQKNSTKRYDSSDLYKPRFNFGSTSSSRAAIAQTVFSE